MKEYDFCFNCSGYTSHETLKHVTLTCISIASSCISDYIDVSSTHCESRCSRCEKINHKFLIPFCRAKNVKVLCMSCRELSPHKVNYEFGAFTKPVKLNYQLNTYKK